MACGGCSKKSGPALESKLAPIDEALLQKLAENLDSMVEIRDRLGHTTKGRLLSVDWDDDIDQGAAAVETFPGRVTLVTLETVRSCRPLHVMVKAPHQS